jgi:predicted RNA-binding protein YlqC (UPF0109 family)
MRQPVRLKQSNQTEQSMIEDLRTLLIDICREGSPNPDKVQVEAFQAGRSYILSIMAGDPGESRRLVGKDGATHKALERLVLRWGTQNGAGVKLGSTNWRNVAPVPWHPPAPDLNWDRPRVKRMVCRIGAVFFPGVIPVFKEAQNQRTLVAEFEVEETDESIKDVLAMGLLCKRFGQANGVDVITILNAAEQEESQPKTADGRFSKEAT